MSTPNDLIPSQEAMRILGISTKTMAHLLKEKIIKHYTKPLDRRIKWVSRAAVERLRNTYQEAA